MPGDDRYARAKRMFLTASGLPKGERTRFLNSECSDDPTMLVQVRQLLTADEQDTAFLETPALQIPGDDLLLGTRLGRFLIERVLGEGGMGVVYEAQQDEPARRVALKVIRPGILSPRLRSRFRHEIRILGQLRHPGIAQIYEAGTLELAGAPVPYFAMELIEGDALPEHARTLTLRGRLALVAQICDAVHHAHQKGVIHRDLKPGNILVEEAPSTDSSAASDTVCPFQIKVLDFGIARATDADIRAVTIQTDVGQLVGTLPYMSPEQAAGDPDAIDIRSDLYSIGVIAYELLAGRLPHTLQGLPLHEAARIVHDAEPTRLGTIDRALRGDVETIIAKALEKDRQHRYQSAAELAADIRRFLRDEPIVARPASALYQLRKFARRHKPLVVATGLVCAAMAGATIVSTWQARIAVRARTLAETEQARANRSADVALQEARRATLAATAAAIDSGNPIDARRVLESTDERRRGWAWNYWNARLDDSVAAIQTGGRSAGVWVSPDASRIIALARDGQIAGGSPWTGSLTPGPRLALSPVAAAAFTADARQIIAVCGADRRTVAVFDAGDGSMIRHVADLPAPGVLAAVSADGGTVCVAVKRIGGLPIADDVWLWAGDAPGRLIRANTRTTGIALTPDGRWLAGGFDHVVCWETAATAPAWSGPLDRDFAVFAISDDGALIASGGQDKTVRLWDRATGAAGLALRGHAGDITALAFDPAGRTLASASTDLAIRLWDVAAGKCLASLAGHTARIRTLRFAPDGSHFLSTADDGSIRLWDAHPYESTCVLRGHTSFVYAAACTPDGSRIVSGAWDQTVRIWDAAGGTLLRTIPAGPGFITSLVISPDGRAVATGHKIGEWEPVRVSLWSADTGDELDHFSFGRGELHGLAFDRAGTRLWAAWERGGAGVADLTTHGPSMHTLVSRQGIYSLALSPDQRRIAYGDGAGKIWLNDAADGRQLRGWTGHTGAVRALAFCPNRPILASASADATVRLWNSDTGALIAKLDRHWGPVYSLAFSPDGQVLASGSDDTTIRIWDPASGDELTQLRGHEAYIYSLAFSPDGSRLISGSGDHTVRIWDTRPVHERWRARAASSP